MPTVIVDGREIEIGSNERLNCIEAARRAGAEIPHYCWHPGLSVVASCRMCLIEVGSRDAETGKTSMVPKLVPACQTPAKDGTVIVTESSKVKESRARVEEALLIDHPVDCPICDKAGECRLQDYHFEHGQAQRRADIHPFTSRKRDVGPTVSLFVDRCIMCTRCVRFTREVAGTGELMVSSRGSKEEIDIFPGYPLDNKLSGNVVDLCPVGALGDKDFLYQQRVWFLKREDGVCGGCSAGCSIHTEHNQDTIYRLKPRENQHVNKWWICDEGRYGWHHLHDPSRLVEPKRHGKGNAAAEPVEWADIIELLRSDLAAATANGGRLAVAVSPMLTVEEAWMLCSVARSIDPQAMLAVGFVPTSGEDESFPGGFTIRSEKCPNRVGVEHVIAGFDPTVPRWETLLDAVESGSCTAAWISAAYPPAGNRPPSEAASWIDEATAARFEKLRCLIVQDLFTSPLADRADWLLPAAGFAERSGTWVNHAQWAQSFERAIRAPSGVWPEGRLLWNMLGRHRLYDPAVI
ncbi:MAG: (2Fe-2S)-binding protein, partial [Pirellulales bacterium]|nr:(2Fe-2S)-binding protein [Pirellulales bacterium]